MNNTLTEYKTISMPKHNNINLNTGNIFTNNYNYTEYKNITEEHMYGSIWGQCMGWNGI